MDQPNEPAFPCDVDMGHQTGLTKREYFAGLSLQGILANPEQFQGTVQELSETAVTYADAILKELNK